MSTYEPEPQFNTKKYKCNAEDGFSDICQRLPIVGCEGCLYWRKT